MKPIAWFKSVVQSCRPEGNGFRLTIDLTCDYFPGQIVGIKFSDGDEPRWYSIAGGSDRLDIIFTPIDGGYLTSRLCAVKPGDALLVSEARGSFVEPLLPSGSSRLWWICNGTGIAPFLAMIEKQLARHPGDDVQDYFSRRILVAGIRRASDLFGAKAVDDAERSGLVVQRCVSQKEPNEPGWDGRLGIWMAEHADLEKARVGGDTFMLCGGAGMIDSTRELLVSRGIDYSRILAEVYF